MLWIKNTEGKPDAMLTFALFSFGVVTLNVLLSTFGVIAIAGTSISFQALDSSIMAVYLGSTFTAYVSRRWTDKKYTPPMDPSQFLPGPGGKSISGELDSSESSIDLGL